MPDDDDIKYLQGQIVISSKIISPAMVIKNLEYEGNVYNNKKFIGLRVYWWSDGGDYYETVLHAKDLKHYDKVPN